MLLDAITNSTIGKWVAKQWTGGSQLLRQGYSVASSFFTEPDVAHPLYGVSEGRINPTFTKFAKAGFEYFTEQREGINSQRVSGSRVRAPRDQSLPNMRGASQSNIGNVPRVLSAGQSAQRAAQGSPIEATISQVAYRQSRSPLVKLESGTEISIKPRAK